MSGDTFAPLLVIAFGLLMLFAAGVAFGDSLRSKADTVREQKIRAELDALRAANVLGQQFWFARQAMHHEAQRYGSGSVIDGDWR
jgi:hypothetical protein